MAFKVILTTTIRCLTYQPILQISVISKVHTLVSTDWLNTTLTESKSGDCVRVLDVSFVPDKGVDGYEEFLQSGHIQGAQYFDLHKNVDSTDLLPRNLPDVSRFEDYVRSLGVDSDSHVVMYDRTNNMAAARLWWMMRLYGHERTSVLDGGLAKWISDGFTVTTDEVITHKKSDFKAVFNGDLVRNFEAILENVKSKKEQLIDARSHHSFAGQIPNSGHIPESVNIPFATLFNLNGTFKSQEDLKNLFEHAEVDPSRPLVATCGTGMTACSLALAATILGRNPTPVYYGSWTEWRGRAPSNLCLTSRND